MNTDHFFLFFVPSARSCWMEYTLRTVESFQCKMLSWLLSARRKNLKAICEEIIPRKLTDVWRLISGLSNHIGHLHQDDFERTLLTLVYTAQEMANSTTEHQRDAWTGSFVSLYKAIKQDLTGTN